LSADSRGAGGVVSGDGAGLPNDASGATAVRAQVGTSGTDTRDIYNVLRVLEGEEARAMTSLRLFSTICAASNASTSSNFLSKDMDGLSAILKALTHPVFVKKVGLGGVEQYMLCTGTGGVIRGASQTTRVTTRSTSRPTHVLDATR
jgi:hypothetical protein